MHGHNMMMRPDTEQHVIIDPFSYLYSKNIDGWSDVLPMNGRNIRDMYVKCSKNNPMPEGLTFTV